MGASWATRKELEQNVFRVASDNNVNVDSIDKDMLNQGLENSQDAILQVLRKRGYSMAQIESWRQLKEYHLDIGTWFTLNRMGFRRGDEEDWISFYNRLAELAEILLFDVSGDLITPAGTSIANPPFRMWDLEDINSDLGQEP